MSLRCCARVLVPSTASSTEASLHPGLGAWHNECVKLGASSIVVLAWILSAGCGGSDVDESVPDVAFCDPVTGWDAEWTAIENDVLALVNQARSVGHNCDSEGNFGPASALTMNPALRCAARVHSLDMQERDFFAHTNPSNEGPSDRVESAGYLWRRVGENIAVGYGSAESVMEGWLDSDGHCSNLMNPGYTEIGVGYYPTDGPYWTQAFGTPR